MKEENVGMLIFFVILCIVCPILLPILILIVIVGCWPSRKSPKVIIVKHRCRSVNA